MNCAAFTRGENTSIYTRNIEKNETKNKAIFVLTIDDLLVQLAEAGLHVTAEVDDLKGGVFLEELCLTPQRSGPDDRAICIRMSPPKVIVSGRMFDKGRTLGMRTNI